MTRIGIVSPIMGEASVEPFSNLVRVLQSIASSTVVIEVYCRGTILECIHDEDSIIFKKLVHATGKNKIETVLRHILTQLKMGLLVASLARRVDLWVFYTPGDLTIPLMAAKLLGKRVVISIGGDERSIVHWTTMNSRGLVLERITIPFVIINRFLADIIVLFSPILIEQWDMRQYAWKIRIANNHFLDVRKFNVERGIDARSTNIGYVGRLSPEKGTMQFVEAIPLVLREVKDARFIITGDGSLRSSVEAYVRMNGLEDRVSVMGWVPHDELPEILNKLRLLIMPSYTEGLPNVMLEAMACGTPVLATPVGAIPDVIVDGETGFLMPDNSPEAIAQNIVRALGSGVLGEVTKNVYEFARRTYTLENTMKEWKEILRDL
jgi:glycosyltransferase involved in cell wall biosynthesis